MSVDRWSEIRVEDRSRTGCRDVVAPMQTRLRCRRIEPELEAPSMRLDARPRDGQAVAITGNRPACANQPHSSATTGTTPRARRTAERSRAQSRAARPREDPTRPPTAAGERNPMSRARRDLDRDRGTRSPHSHTLPELGSFVAGSELTTVHNAGVSGRGVGGSQGALAAERSEKVAIALPDQPAQVRHEHGALSESSEDR